MEARGRTRYVTVSADNGRGAKKATEGSLLTVRGSQMDSSSPKERFGGAEAAAGGPYLITLYIVGCVGILWYHSFLLSCALYSGRLEIRYSVIVVAARSTS